MQELYNGNILIPDVFAPPKWFEDTKKIIKERVLMDMKKTGKLNKNLVKDILEEIIEHKFKIKYPLNKDNVNDLFDKLYKAFGNDVFLWKYQIIYEFGFFLSTLNPSSFSPESMILPERFKKAKLEIDKEFEKSKKTEKDILKAIKKLDKLAEEVMAYFRQNNIDVVDLIDSGSKGSVDDIRKLLLGVGVSINSTGNINDFILRSHTEGLTKKQFFNYSSQAIVALYSKSQNTAKPGYLIRKLYTIMDNLELSKHKDCGTNRYFKFKIPTGKEGEKILKNLKGRYYKSSFSLEKLSQIPKDITDVKNLLGKTIELRSPLYCKARDGICETCYGSLYVDELNLKPGDPIGKLSVNSFAESLVNITLKSSHTGLKLDMDEVDLIKDFKKYVN